jgi:hypothetical protein
MVYGPDGTEYSSWEEAIAAGVTNPSYIKPVATTQTETQANTQAGTQANIPTYGYELAQLMAQYGVTSPTPPRTTDQSLINQYFARLNAPMYAAPVGNDLFNRYLDIGMGKLPGGGGPMTRFFPGQAVCADGQRFDPVTAKCVSVTDSGGVASAGRITTGTPNIGGNQCPPGFTYNAATKSCVPGADTGLLTGGNAISAQQPAPTCPPNTVYDPVNKICLPTGCPAGYERDASGNCVAKSMEVACPTGFTRDPVTKVCVPIVTSCPEGQTRNAAGQCVPIQTGCPEGQARNAAGNCVPIVTSCPAGQERNAAGQCVPVVRPCPEGQIRNAAGQCVAQEPTPCPAGQRRNAAGNCEWDLTAEEKAWVEKSKSFSDDQWREAIAEWVRSNPTATKAQADLRALQLGVPERLIPYGYEAADYIDNPLASQGLAPATAATQFLTPGVTTGPGGADLYKMLNENIQYAVDPRSLGGAGISENEALQMWDLAKTLGLSVPQIAEKVNVMANLNMSNAEIADVIRRIAPDEADAYFAMTGTNYDPNARRFRDGGLAKLAKKYAAGGDVKQDPMMGLLKKYQQGGLNTTDAYDQLNQARANLRSTIEQLSSQEEVKPPSKAEMYFRLAAAFATPTKTGDFGESLGLAAQQMAEYKGEQRESQRQAQQQRRDLALELAKLDLETAQGAYEKSVASQQPGGPIGRNCKDLYALGSAEYQACLRAGIEAEQQTAKLQRENVESLIESRERQGEPPQTYSRFEQGLLDQYTQRKKSAQVAAGILLEAMKLNDEAYTESYSDIIRRTGSRLFNQDDPKLAIYEFMQNRLSANALASLKATFPGAISNAERDALDRLQGALSATREGRQMIFEATMGTMLDSIENSDAEIKKVEGRYYAGPQETTPSETNEEITP